MRAVIYARYSSDLQNDKSVEDQIRLCTDYAVRIGARIVEEYSDRAKSGASMFGRPGLAHLMQAAERGEFDLLIAEAPDRISRDIADLAHVHKTLKFREIGINCVNGGQIDTVQVGMFGVIGQMQREEGAKKTKRGMMGVVKSGRNAGGRSYGYRTIAGKPGELEIVENEAAIVRRVFELYVGGFGPKSIAAMLNEDGVAAPRGQQWNASTINGNDKRGHGILRNPLYSGRIVWNRVRMVKDPSTGRRVSRTNDESVIETFDAPHLRIIDQQLFEAAAKRKDAVGGPHARTSPRNKRLLSGLMKCGACGGGMSIIGADRSGPRVVCSRQKESGTCTNTARYYIAKIENDVIERLRLMFADTSLIDTYVEEYKAESKRIAVERRNSRGSKETALAEIQSQIARVLDQVAKGTIDEEDVLAILPGLKSERARLRADLEAEEPVPNIIELKPKAVEKFRENVENIAQIVANKGLPTPDLAIAFRNVVSSVIVHPRKAGEKYHYEIKGKLAAIAGEQLSSVLMVAGDRVGLDSRQGEQSEISLGTWQIALKRVMANYLKSKVPEAANSGPSSDGDRRSHDGGSSAN